MDDDDGDDDDDDDDVVAIDDAILHDVIDTIAGSIRFIFSATPLYPFWSWTVFSRGTSSTICGQSVLQFINCSAMTVTTSLQSNLFGKPFRSVHA